MYTSQNNLIRTLTRDLMRGPKTPLQDHTTWGALCAQVAP